MVAHVKLSWCQVLEFSCRWTSGGFSVEKRWCRRHSLSWGHPCGSTYGSPDVILLPQGFLVTLHLGEGLCWHPELQLHCCSLSQGQLAVGHRALSQVAPCPQPVAMELQPHVPCNVGCPCGELWSPEICCHCSWLFLARREKMISHACQSGSFLQHWISASLFKFLFKNPNLRQHSTWHLTLWLPWR